MCVCVYVRVCVCVCVRACAHVALFAKQSIQNQENLATHKVQLLKISTYVT